jgi:hypothetical protein
LVSLTNRRRLGLLTKDHQLMLLGSHRHRRYSRFLLHELSL